MPRLPPLDPRAPSTFDSVVDVRGPRAIDVSSRPGLHLSPRALITYQLQDRSLICTRFDDPITVVADRYLGNIFSGHCADRFATKAEVGGSIAEVARRHSFANPGRFVTACRGRFGEAPSETAGRADDPRLREWLVALSRERQRSTDRRQDHYRKNIRPNCLTLERDMPMAARATDEAAARFSARHLEMLRCWTASRRLYLPCTGTDAR